MSSYPGKLTSLAVSMAVLVAGAFWMLFQGHLIPALLLAFSAGGTGLYFLYTRRAFEYELKRPQQVITVRDGDH